MGIDMSIWNVKPDEIQNIKRGIIWTCHELERKRKYLIILKRIKLNILKH